MAIRINRVYTRTGDDGTTAVVGGARVPKTDLRIAAYGDVDELNSVIGLVRAELGALAEREAAEELDRTLGFLQQEMFDLGSELATPPEAEYEGMIRIEDAQIERLEDLIDRLSAELEPLKSFVLPGGGRAGATLHVARTVCRRAERTVAALVAEGRARAQTARYLNRLSDFLFVAARWIAKQTGVPETLWQKGLAPPPGSRRPAGKRAQGGSPAGGGPRATETESAKAAPASAEKKKGKK